MNHLYHFTETRWDDEGFYLISERCFEFWADVPAPEPHDNNPIREALESAFGWLMCKLDELSGKLLEIDDDDDLELIVKWPPVYHFLRFLEALSVDLWSAVWIGSEAHYNFCVDHPAELYPRHHNLPDFGSFPIIKLS